MEWYETIFVTIMNAIGIYLIVICLIFLIRKLLIPND